MGLLYRFLYPLALLVAGPFLLLTRARHYLPTLAGRSTLRLPVPQEEPLWIHGVSVGEAMVAGTLARALPESVPLLVTTITPTGQERARSLLGNRAAVSYLPFDLGWAVNRFLRRTRPRGLVLVEGDYWPRLLDETERRDVPVFVVNGRVGDGTYRRLAGREGIARWLFGSVRRFGVQSELDRERLETLGVDGDRIRVTGNLKYEAADPNRNEDLERRLTGLADGRPILVAGSTMPGEEEQVLAAFEALSAPALLVLAPRHPERWGEVADSLRSSTLRFSLRSRLDQGEAGAAAQVILLDSLGELADVYRYAAGAFVGGTLVPTGGHNPLEPARFGTPVVVGPSMTNFRDMADQFDRADAWCRVADARGLASVWSAWLEDPGGAKSRGEKARRLVEENRGALERTIELLEPLL